MTCFFRSIHKIASSLVPSTKTNKIFLLAFVFLQKINCETNKYLSFIHFVHHDNLYKLKQLL